MALPLTRRRFTVDEYYRMAEVGILTADDRVELLDGEIVEMAPIGRRHAGSVNRVAEHFFRGFMDVATITVQNPVRLSELSEPEPDLALLHRRADYYTSGHPRPTDVYLLVEIADTSAATDLRVKIPLYSLSGIPEMWLADLEADQVLVHRDPGPAGYKTITAVQRGEMLAPQAFPDRSLPATALLGPR
jgi:Uma2 family endonuclease